MTNPNEPTLTCSEVVERLRRNCLPGKAFQSFDVTKAEKILDEWRERRVQELEELLAKHSRSLNSADSASNTESTRTAKETR